MSFAALGSVAVIEARASFPRIGIWTADVRVDSPVTFSGRQVLRIGDAFYSGTVRSSLVHRGTAHVRLIAGAGNMGKELPSKGYISTPISVPLGDICKETGETLASSSHAEVRSHQLPHWSRSLGSAGEALASLMEAVPGAVWRFTPAGELWVGVESWPKAAIVHELIGYEPMADKLELFSAEPRILPGSSFLGRPVSYVEHRVGANDVRTHVWFERA